MRLILISVFMLVIATIGAGVYFFVNEEGKDKSKIKKTLRYNLMAFIPIMTFAVFTMVPDIVLAVTEGAATGASGLGFIAVALSTGLAAIGAGYAVGTVGSAALGAVSEDPTILGKTLIFVGLAEGIAIYGLIISIMILGRL